MAQTDKNIFILDELVKIFLNFSACSLLYLGLRYFLIM